MNAVQIIIKHLKETGKISDIVLWRALNESYEHHTKVSSWYWVKRRDVKLFITDGDSVEECTEEGEFAG